MQYTEFLERFNGIDKISETVSIINPDDTIVITRKKTLNEAIAYFSLRNKVMPDFVLIDWDGKEQISQTVKDMRAAYCFNVYPYTKKEKIQHKKFCLYAPIQKNLGDGNSIVFLHLECLRKGFNENFCFLEDIVPHLSESLYQQYVIARLPDACTIYKNLACEESRQIFLQTLKALATGNINYLSCSDYRQYYHPKVKATSDDKVIIDGGSLNGGTSIDFAGQTSPNTHILSFEAVPSLYAVCRENVKQYDNIEVVPYALWKGSDTFFIVNKQGGSFITKDKQPDSEECHSLALDDFYLQHDLTDCSLIKLDIEGAEPEALEGAEKIIRKYSPKLQISIYHNIQQFFDIPLYLMSKYPDYEFYLGHHTMWFWETILYARKKES